MCGKRQRNYDCDAFHIFIPCVFNLNSDSWNSINDVKGKGVLTLFSGIITKLNGKNTIHTWKYIENPFN